MSPLVLEIVLPLRRRLPVSILVASINVVLPPDVNVKLPVTSSSLFEKLTSPVL